MDDVRAAYYRQAPAQAWIREVHLDPLELVVADDRDGTTSRVPVIVSASGQISFGQPVRVQATYVESDPTRVDASRLVYASRDARTGTPVQATISSRREPGAMAQPQHVSTRSPVDHPRQPGESLLIWGIRTGRIEPGGRDERTWRDHIAASASAAEHVLSVMTPGCAVPLAPSGRAYSPVAAAAPPAAADRRWYRANPLVEDLRDGGGMVYADAVGHGGPVPTLFASGDLPAMTSSGLDPSVLRGLPWPVRHPVASAVTAAEAEDLMQQVAEMGEHFSPAEFMAHDGNRDYEMRVRDWSMRAISAAADHRRTVQAAQALQLQQVAAASTPTPAELDDDEIYSRVFGDSDRQDAQHGLERLYAIAAGGAVAPPISQMEARAELERLARGDGEIGGRYGGPVPVPPDAAQAMLTRLDRELSR